MTRELTTEERFDLLKHKMRLSDTWKLGKLHGSDELSIYISGSMTEVIYKPEELFSKYDIPTHEEPPKVREDGDIEVISFDSCDGKFCMRALVTRKKITRKKGHPMRYGIVTEEKVAKGSLEKLLDVFVD